MSSHRSVPRPQSGIRVRAARRGVRRHFQSVWPSSSRTARDRRGVEGAQIGRSLRIRPSSLKNRARSALFKRRVVQIRIRDARSVSPAQVARARSGRGLQRRFFTALHRSQERFELVDVHRLLKTVAHGLVDQRVVRGSRVPDQQGFRRKPPGQERPRSADLRRPCVVAGPESSFRRAFEGSPATALRSTAIAHPTSAPPAAA